MAKFKGVVEDRILIIARRLLGYTGSSKMIFDGVGTYSMRFADGSMYVIETCEDAVRARATGASAEWYQLLLRVINATEL